MSEVTEHSICKQKPSELSLNAAKSYSSKLSALDEHYIHESEYAHFLNYKREQYPDLLELVEIKTPWFIIEEILLGNYEHITEEIEHSLAYDTLRIMAANLW